MLKKLFNFFLLLFISLFFFLISDYFISKHTNLFHIKKDCFKYLRFKNNDKEYYSYELEKNCYAFENKGTTFAYKVVTNNLGHRIANKNLEKDLEKEKIIFLGDSFTYGFGINYKDSIPGQIDKKTNNKFEVINFAMPGYSPSINLYKLEEYLKNSKKLKIKKIFYVMDLSDVHDESNRWSNIKNINLPVIIDENIKKEIKDTFEFKQNFRTSKFLSSLVNNNVRNFRKKIKFYFSKNKVVNSLDVKTFWGKFTYTSTSNLANDVEYRKLWPVDYKIGIKNIKKKIKKISDLIKPYNTEFYIVIHPWKETLEYGQEEFNWEFFANEICILTNCNKVISLFDDVRDLKRENILWKSEIYFKKDVHFNKKGNDLYSNRIYFDAFN
jgi:hypothetical protein